MTNKIILGESIHPLIKANASVENNNLKSTLIAGDSQSRISDLVSNLTSQLINEDSGMILFDLNDNFDDEFLENLPSELHSRIEVFDPTHFEKIPGLNILDVKEIDQAEKDRPDLKKVAKAVDSIFEIFDKIYNLKAFGGPVLEAYFKNTLKLVAGHPESGSSIALAHKILTDDDFRSFKLAMCDDKDVVDFWEKEVHTFEGVNSFENMTPYIAAKLAPFVSNYAFGVIAQPKTTVDFKNCIADNKILFVRLDSSKLGTLTQEFLGMLILAQIELDLSEISKSKIKSGNKPTIVIPNLDKFINQNFVNILSEYHEYLRFIVSTNNLESLNEIKNYFPNEIKFRHDLDPSLASLNDNQAIFKIRLDDDLCESIPLKVEKYKLSNPKNTAEPKTDFYIKSGMTEADTRKRFENEGDLLFHA